MHTHKFKSSNSCRMHTHAKTIKLYTDLWKWPSSVVVALAWSLGFHILETDSLRFGSNNIIYVFPPGSGFFVWGPFFLSSLSRQLIACFRATRGHYGKQHIYDIEECMFYLLGLSCCCFFVANRFCVYLLFVVVLRFWWQDGTIYAWVIWLLDVCFCKHTCVHIRTHFGHHAGMCFGNLGGHNYLCILGLF